MSQALQYFEERVELARSLTNANLLQGMPNSERQPFYHVEIAAWVAAWDAYLNRVIPEAIVRIGNPLDQEVLSLRLMLSNHAEQFIEKFNTPNFDNSRNLLVRCVGYDPIAHWNWPMRGMTWQLVQTRLNEILRVRHSFAHGFALPQYNWLPTKSGEAYLNRTVVMEVGRLLKHLARSTDSGIDTFLKANYIYVNPVSW
jgi:hypothetical protein